MSNIIIASNNSGKVKEFELLFEGFSETILSLKDLPQPIEVEETGLTFEENARLKAEAVSELTGETVISDDSGLMIDRLDGRPGVFSARFAGVNKDDKANIEKVLDLMKGIPLKERTAQFITVLAIAKPDTPTRFIVGRCDGIITEKVIGEDGFGYDPIFFIPEKNKTFAQMTRVEKNEISHRGRAMNELKEQWQTLKGDVL